jgi:hypothetical protein
MGLFNKKNKIKYSIKRYLTDSEFAASVGTIVKAVFNEEYPLPFYAMKDMVINQGLVSTYTDIEEFEDTYDIIKDIECKVDIFQYYKLRNAIDEGIEYELSKQVSNIFDTAGLDDSGQKLEEVVEKVGGMENFTKLISIAQQNTIIKAARDEVKKEQAG